MSKFTKQYIGTSTITSTHPQEGGLLLSGWYGGGNVGDEAILAALVQTLRERAPDLALAALSVNPDYTAEAHGVTAISRQPLAALAAIRRCKVFALGGGGTVQDTTSALNLPSFLLYPLLAKRLGKPVLWSGVGVGPLRTKLGRGLARLAANQADAITVRDAASADLLRKVGAPMQRVRVTADPGLLLRPADEAALKVLAASGIAISGAGSDSGQALHPANPGPVSAKPLVILAVRRPLDPALHGLRPGYLLPVSVRERFGTWSAAAGRLLADLTTRLATLADYFAAEHGADILFVPFDPVDAEIADGVIGQMRHAGAAHTAPARLHPTVAMGLVNAADAVVAMRLHALIFAAACGKPALGLSYDRKVASFMAQVGLADYCSSLNASDLREKSNDLWQKRVTIAKSLRTRVDELKGSAVENATILIAASRNR